jgi:hypothetical protein
MDPSLLGTHDIFRRLQKTSNMGYRYFVQLCCSKGESDVDAYRPVP